MPSKRAWARVGRLALFCATSTILTGCANKLPGPEAEAFSIISTANKAAFTELNDQQLAAQVLYAKRAILSGNGRVIVEPGCNSPAKGDCIVTYSLSGNDSVKLARPAIKARALLGSISRYGESMSELAKAQDLEAVYANADKAAGSVKSLVLAVAPAASVAAPIIDLLTMAAKSSLREKRRAALLQVASAADPAIQDAAGLLNGMLNPMKTDITRSAAREVGDIQERMVNLEIEERRLAALKRPTNAQKARLASLRAQRSAELDLLVASADKLNAMRGIDLDFSELAKAHSKLVNKLKNPDVSAEDLFKDLNQVLVLMDQIKAATQKES